MNVANDATRSPREGKPDTGLIYALFLNPRWAYDHAPEEAKEALRRIERDLPEARDIVQAIRIFVRRATTWFVSNGIDQIIDFGSGLPTDNNTHEVAHYIDPAVRVVYIDNDPSVAQEAARTCANVPNVVFLDADICQRERLLENIQATGLIDFDQPVGLMMSSVLHLISEQECQQAGGVNTHRLVRDYLDAVVPGSCLAVAHLTEEVDDVERLRHVLTYIHAVPRTDDEIRGYFAGTELVSPGKYDKGEPPYDLAWSNLWQAARPHDAGRAGRWIKVGVGRKN